MPTQKKFLDEAGLIQLLQEIESLDETNLKDVYWSTDNADVNPTIVFKQGDDNGAAHSIHKVTFAGDTSSNTETALTGTKYEVHSITITIGGVSKTISYLVTTRLPSTAVTHSHQNDTGDPTAANTVKVALDRIVTKLNSLKSTNITMNAAISGLNITTSDTVQSAFEKVNTAIANIDPVDEKVKQTAQTENKALPILTAVSATPTSGNSAEAGYDTAMTFNPRDDALTITGGTTTSSSKTIITPGKVDVQKEAGGITTKVSVDDMHITFNQGNTEVGSVNPVSYTGKATGTENSLASTASGSEGAKMVGYTTNTTVKDAIDDIYATIGGDGDGGDSIIERVSALEDGENLIQGTNVTLTKDTTNHTVTIAAADEKVSQSSDTSSTLAIPLLLASGSTPTSPAGAKFNPKLSFKPSTNELKLGSSAIGVEMSFKEGEITFSSSVNSATINATNYSGTAAQATADGSGNNIVNTYATKAALEELSQKWTGQFMVLKNSGDTQEMYAAMTRIIAAIKGGEEPATADMALFDLGYIYLYPNTVVAEDNVFDEYIKVSERNGADYTMEKIGTTDAGVDVVTIPATGTNSVHSYFVQYVINA